MSNENAIAKMKSILFNKRKGLTDTDHEPNGILCPSEDQNTEKGKHETDDCQGEYENYTTGS